MSQDQKTVEQKQDSKPAAPSAHPILGHLVQMKKDFVAQLESSSKRRQQLMQEIQQLDSAVQQLTGAITAMDMATQKAQAPAAAPAAQAPSAPQAIAPQASAASDAPSPAPVTAPGSTDDAPAAPTGGSN